MSKPKSRSTDSICPLCGLVMTRTVASIAPIDRCPTCDGIWIDREAVRKLREHLHVIRWHWEAEHNPPKARPGLYDLDHVDSQRPANHAAEIKRRWVELLEVFE